MTMTNTTHKAGARTLAALLAVALLAPSLFFVAPSKAQAVVFTDPVNLVQNTLQAVISGEINVKEFVLDPLAHAAARMAIQSIIRSTINWANSGFEGSPAYVTNLRQDLRRLADREADRFLGQLAASGAIDSPFRDQVVSGIRGSYRRATANNAFFEQRRYTLDEFATNDEAFINGDLSQGGLSAWVEAWRNDQNNVFGAFRSANQELQRRVSEATGDRVTQLSWSRGVFSWCSEPEGAEAPVEGTELTQGPAGGSAECQVQTPGSWIHDRIERSLGADIDSLISADEINEVVGALLNGLANKIIGGSGFAGLSQPSQGGGPSAVDAAAGTQANDPLLSGNFTGVIAGQADQIERFKDNWESIRDAAAQVQEVCSNDTLEARANVILTEANAAIAKADAALAELGQIRTKLLSNDTEDMREGYAQYEALSASNRLPSGAEMARSVRESQNDEDISPMTLRTEMERALQRSCRD